MQHIMTTEERLDKAAAYEEYFNTNPDGEPKRFKGFGRVWVSMLRDIDGYPIMLSLDNNEV